MATHEPAFSVPTPVEGLDLPCPEGVPGVGRLAARTTLFSATPPASMAVLPLFPDKAARVAQIFSSKSSLCRETAQLREDRNLGSPGLPASLGPAIMRERRPKMLRSVALPGAAPAEIHLHGLLDMGVNITILPLAAWPPEWPLNPVKEPSAGLGGATQIYRSLRSVVISNEGDLQPTGSIGE
ncbi:uncharacterized protein M8220_003910 [Acridotheres tristis]